MSTFGQMWEQYSSRAKVGIVVGTLLILGSAAGIGWWAYQTDYGVLFADLSTGDASAMVAELERSKIPYQLADGGRTILVPKEMVYKTRLKVMGKELPLHGAVGFEVFNNADFGMTEFVQKVNYQRAVQGELTRTIMSIENVQSARVHLALPEQGLFKKSGSKPKASVSVVMKSGHSLNPEQISGIQRLVAASVPDISALDVTITDQHGVSLTKAASGDPAVEAAHTQLDSKRQMENYMGKKLGQVLDQMYGAGNALVSIDVQVNLDQDKITTEDILPAKSNAAHPDGIPTGVIVRERQTTQNSAVVATATNSSGAGRDSGAGNSTVESEYQVGRRVAQTVVAPGTIKRMTVAVVVKTPLSAAQQAQLKEVVALSVGINPQRGDALVVQSMEQVMNGAQVAPANAAATAAPATAAATKETGADAAMPAAPAARQNGISPVMWGALVAAALLLIGMLLLLKPAAKPQSAAAMSQDERERMLQDIKQWIASEKGGRQ